MPFVDDAPPQQPVQATSQRGFVDDVPKAAPAQAAPKRGFVDEQPTQTTLQAATQEPHLQAANEGLQGGFAEGQRRVAESWRHPLDAALNILQTPQRAATGLAAGIEQRQGLGALGHALYNAFNPDEGNDDLDKIVGQVQGKMPKTDNPVGQFAEHFAAQMLTDPLTVLPVLALAKKSLMATKLAQEMISAGKELGIAIPGVKQAVKVGQKAHSSYLEHIGNELSKVNTIRPELDPHLTTGGKSARLGIEHRNIAKMNDELGHSDQELLKKHDATLRAVKATANKGYELPEDIRQRYLQEPWRYGTPGMRRQAEELGFHPTEADAKWENGPENVLDYDLRKDYQYLGDPARKMSNAPAFAASGGKYGPAEAGFEKSRIGNWDGLEADQRARVAARLQMGRDFVRKRRVDQETKTFLEKHGGWKGEQGIDVTKLSHAPTRVWAASPLRAFSRLGKESILASALPHLMNNMGTLTMWQGGVPALARSAVYMLKPPTAKQVARLKSMGAHSDYGRDFAHIIGANIPGAKQWLHRSNAILDRSETAMRQAILDQLDKTMGASKNAADEFHKSQVIRDSLGDYRNVSAFISLMDSLGAPFAPFMGVLSKAAKRTIASPNAYRFEAPLRAQQDLNQQTEESGQGDFIVPNPASAFAQLATGSGFLSPSRTGPLPQILAEIGKSKAGYPDIQNFWNWAAEQAQSYGGPIASNAPSFFGMPFPSPDKDAGQFDPLTGLLHLFLGDYWKNPSSEKPDMRIQRDADRASGL